MTFPMTPCFVTPEAFAVARRLEELDLLDPDMVVQLLPVCLPETDTVNYVLRYYQSEYRAELIAQVHFLEVTADLSKSAKLIEHLQQELGWGLGDMLPNYLLLRKLPTPMNIRRYELPLAVQQR